MAQIYPLKMICKYTVYLPRTLLNMQIHPTFMSIHLSITSIRSIPTVVFFFLAKNTFK